MNIGDRIAKEMADKGWSEGELSRRSGVTQPTIHRIISGESNSPRQKNVEQIAKALGVTAEFLWKGVSSTLTGSETPYPRTPSEADFVLIPQLSVVGECGDGHLNGHIEIEGGLAFRRDWLTKLSVKPEHCRALYAEGASMEPYIFEDDIVLVDTSDRLPKDRTPYAIRRADGGISFKRLIRQLSGTWLLRSDNPDKAMYPDEEVSATAMHDIPIIGRIVWRGGQM